MVKNHVEGNLVHLKRTNNWMKCLKVFLVSMINMLSMVNNVMIWKKGKKYLTTLMVMNRTKFATIPTQTRLTVIVKELLLLFMQRM